MKGADVSELHRDVRELWRLLLQTVIVLTVAVMAVGFLALAALIMASR